MKKYFNLNFLILFFLLINNNLFSFISLEIDEINISNLITNNSITNISQKTIIEQQLPNTYLKTGKIEVTDPETIARRYDVVFFVAIPITFYLTMNLLMIKNQYFYLKDSTFLYPGDWIYIYINTITVPLVVAYYDYLYVEKQRKLKEYYSYNNNLKNELFIFFNIITYKF